MWIRHRARINYLLYGFIGDLSAGPGGSHEW